MLIVVRKAMAESDLEELRTLLGRMEMYVEEEGGFSRGQRESVVASAAALRTALATPRSPHAGGLPVPYSRDSPLWAPMAYLDGRSEDLEEALAGMSREKVEDVEEKAAWILTDDVPRNTWNHRHRELHARVVRRFERRVVNHQLALMPKPDMVERMRTFTRFWKGEKYKAGLRHEYSSRALVDVKGGVGNRRQGYVCEETEFYVSLIDLAALLFRKRKDNVRLVPRRELFVERRLRELKM